MIRPNDPTSSQRNHPRLGRNQTVNFVSELPYPSQRPIFSNSKHSSKENNSREVEGGSARDVETEWLLHNTNQQLSAVPTWVAEVGTDWK